MIFIKKYFSFILIAFALVGCSKETNEGTPIEQDSSLFVSSGSAEESLESESVSEKKATYNPENGEEMAEFFRDYFSAQVEINAYEFEQEQEMNYMYPEIFIVSSDVADDTVRQITFFEVDAEDIQTILKMANFPEEPVIEEALSFEGELNDPNFGDKYATEYSNDLGLGVDITIKGNMWSEENKKPYNLTSFYDKRAYDEYAG
ncbi:hypothetical protein CAT7_00860 [Carnobacterium sp. AT7]|uniref:hypothetical protein n=1 Tax=Carnobacterium sp. AT7 TaxID=333990 RepID=UPI00015F175C|nr:hypothetical protein [Carnobacterium sp. AT7]EDP68065.1 hypothetical protein CAT7_00860 [Carnobacterium sp. AT7]